MAVVVPEHHLDPLPFHLQQADGGVVTVAAPADLLQGHALQSPQQSPQCGAVAGGGHGPAGVCRRDVPHRGHHPVPDLGEGLRPLHTPEVGTLIEILVQLPVRPGDLRPGTLLPVPQPDLPEPGLRPEVQSPGNIQGGGGGVGPRQVAAVHRVQLLPPEPLPQIVELPVAPGGEIAVVLAVGHPEEVPLRLGVAHQENFGRHGTPSLFSSVPPV